MPDPNQTDQTARIGIAAVELATRAKLNWIFREQPISDRGIDAHLETLDLDGDATGRLIALQIKTGASYLSVATETGYVYGGDRRHLDYWKGHCLPVLVVLHDPSTGVSYWQSVEERYVTITRKDSWKIIVPFAQTLDTAARKALDELADGPLYQRRLRRLELDRPWDGSSR